MQLTFPNTETLEIIPTDDSHRYRAIMGDHLLNIHFSLPYYKEIPKGTSAEFLSETYTLVTPATIKKINTKHFDYQLVMESNASLLRGFKFKNPNDHTLKFPYTATPRQHLQLLIDSLKLRGEIWQIGTCIEAHEKLISYNHNNCAEALQMIAQAFETEWHIEGKTLHLGKVEFYKDNPLPLSYGKGNGFKSGVSRTNESPKITRLFVQGGERNIDRSKYGNKTLLLPKNKEYTHEGTTYISDNHGYSILPLTPSEGGGINEQSLDLSHIYPKRSGVISSVVVANESKNFYDFSDNSIPADCDFSALQIKGEKMTIYFESGMLSGREFEVSKYIHSQRLFKLVPKEEDGVTMPNATFIPKVGDQYAVFGMQMPQSYICNDTDQTGASWEMFKEAVKHFSENKNDSFTFKGDLDGIFAKKNWATIGDRLKLGAYIHFSDANFQKENVKIRIVGLKEFLNNPYSPQIELSNKVQGTGFSSQIQKIKNQEVLIEKAKKDAMSFTKRSFRDAEENLKMIEASINGFSKGINPATIQTMTMLVGDKSLQFDFIHSKINPQKRTFSIFFDKNTKKIHAGGGWLKHFTLGVEEIKPNRPANDFKHWLLPDFVSGYLQPFDKPFYLYAKVSKQNETGEFVLSENPISLEEVPNFYHLLVANINSETSGERGIALMYGFTEVLPGQIKVDKLSSGNGRQYIELLPDKIKIVADVEFSAENRREITQISGQEIEKLKIGGRNLIRNSAELHWGVFVRPELTETLIEGQTYTFSVDVKGNVIGRIFFNDATNGYYTAGSFTDFKRISTSFVFRKNDYQGAEIFPHIYGATEFKRLKLEKGNIATDWSPAPEDLLAEAQSKINQATQESKVAWEQFAIAKAQNASQEAIDTAKAYADAKDQEKEILVKAYADGRISQAEQNAINVAQAKSLLAETAAKAYADGKVSQEERRAIADAEAKYNQAQQNLTNVQNLLQGNIDQKANAPKRTEIDLTALATDLYFPVVSSHLGTTTKRTFRVEMDLRGGLHNVSWVTHPSRSFSLLCHWTTNGSGWGVIAVNRIVQDFAFAWCDRSPILNLSQAGTSSQEVFYLRGGAKYFVYTDHDISVEAHPSGWQSPYQGRFEAITYDEDLVPKSFSADIIQNRLKAIELETEQTAIKSIAEKARDKTLFIDNQTNISGNYVATGALEVGSQNGARAGITGVGLSGNDVRFYAGSDFANRNNAPFKVLDNGEVHSAKLHAKEGCYIGGLKVTSNGLQMEDEIFTREGYQMGLYYDNILFNRTNEEFARFGSNVAPSSSGMKIFSYIQKPNNATYSYGSVIAMGKELERLDVGRGGTGQYLAVPNGRAIHIEEGVITGRHAIFETPYIGHAYWGVIEEHLHLTNTFIFTSAPNHHQSVVLPNSGKIQSIAGSDQVSFELRIIVAHACQQRIRIEGQNGGFLLNNNAERANSSNGHLDMARGDTLILRRYASDYYIMNHRD